MNSTQPKLTISLLQQDILWEQPKANLAKVETLIDQHMQQADSKADIIVVPETFTTGFGDHMARQSEMPWGETFEFAQHIARKHNILFAATWVVKEDNRHYNRLHLIAPDGEFICYDKRHTFRMSSEALQLERGELRFNYNWHGWNIRPAVCYDLRFPVWLRNSPNLGYDILLVCANWPASRHQAWTTLLKARAIENLCYVVGCNRSGNDGTGIEYAGQSAIIDYKGNAIAEAHDKRDAFITATLDAEKLVTFRQHWPFNLDFDTYELSSTKSSR